MEVACRGDHAVLAADAVRIPVVRCFFCFARGAVWKAKCSNVTGTALRWKWMACGWERKTENRADKGEWSLLKPEKLKTARMHHCKRTLGHGAQRPCWTEVGEGAGDGKGKKKGKKRNDNGIKKNKKRKQRRINSSKSSWQTGGKENN